MTIRESPELDNVDPDNPEVLYNIGNQLRAIGEHREAILWYKRIEHGDCLFDAYIAIADACSDLKQWDQAAVYAERAFAISPDSVDTKHVQFNMLCGQGKVKEAEDLISAMENGTDTNPIAHSLRAYLCQLGGDLEAAAYHLTIAIASFPEDADLHARRGWIYCIFLRTLQLRKFWQSQRERFRHGLQKIDEKERILAAIAAYKKIACK